MDSEDVKLIFWAIIIVATVLGPLVERWMKRRRLEKAAEAPPEPEPEPTESPEPMLPYEDMVEKVFGAYIERRKKEFAARQDVVVEEEVAPPVPKAAPPPAPAARPVLTVPAPVSLPEVSLEDRLFGGRPLSSAAKLLLASEILRRPKALRRER